MSIPGRNIHAIGTAVKIASLEFSTFANLEDFSIDPDAIFANLVAAIVGRFVELQFETAITSDREANVLRRRRLAGGTDRRSEYGNQNQRQKWDSQKNAPRSHMTSTRGIGNPAVPLIVRRGA